MPRAVVLRVFAALAVLAPVVFLLPSSAASGAHSLIGNGPTPGWIRFDSKGSGIDAHDGEILQVGNRYYLYGTSYGCGYVRFHGYDNTPLPSPWCGDVSYTSTDMRTWTPNGPLFDPYSVTPTNWQTTCNSWSLSCYRPHVVYDANRHRYVLWVNTYDIRDGVQHGYHVLTSTSPTGPFLEATDGNQQAVLPTLAFPTGGDFDIFQDDDPARTAYIVYTVRNDPLGWAWGYKLVVEQLNATYTSGTGRYVALDTAHTEAPSMFKRDGSYYITMSDPQCAYCGGTGTAYLRASAPLGTWLGVGGSVAPVNVTGNPSMLLSGLSGLLEGTDAAAQRRLAGTRDSDLSFAVRLAPTPSSSVAAVSWLSRMSTAGSGYRFVLTNRSYKKQAARLDFQVLQRGRVVKQATSGVSTTLSARAWATIRQRVVGTRFDTWINGAHVATSKDGRWSSGYAGVGVPSDIGAYVDDVIERAPTDGHALVAANFAKGSLSAFPDLNRYRRHGIRISDDSCGGQPADVAQLTAPGGTTYLYQSDRWLNGDQNEARATQFWGPLSFRSDGSIEPINCARTVSLPVARASAAAGRLNAGQNGTQGFTAVTDITDQHGRGQTFVITGKTRLSSVRLTLFQGDDASGAPPNAPLVVAVFAAADGLPAGPPIAATVVPAQRLSWAPQAITANFPAPPTLTADPGAGARTYAIVLTTASTTGFYGTARSDGTADTYRDGSGLISIGSGALAKYIRQPANDLRFGLSTTA